MRDMCENGTEIGPCEINESGHGWLEAQGVEAKPVPATNGRRVGERVRNKGISTKYAIREESKGHTTSHKIGQKSNCRMNECKH